MKKTVVFSWIFPLDATCGGIERVTLRLMEGLNSRGYNCLFLLHDLERQKFMFDGVEVDDLNDFLNSCRAEILINQNGYSSLISEKLNSAKWTGRYIVCHHNEPMYMRKIYNLSRVATMVCAQPIPFRERLAWFVRLLAYPLWQKIATKKISKTQILNYRRADRYVLLSSRFLPAFSRLIDRTDISKAVAIPNPLSFEISPREAEKFAKKNVVLIVARLNDKEKRISAALRAWRKIESQDSEDWTLRIIGDGPDADFLQKLVNQLGLKRVAFLGRQNPLPHYQSASIFMMTSRVEGWGVTLTEAMQNGVVPVAFDAYASLRDIVSDGETGAIISNGDIAAFAEQTNRLMGDPLRRRTLANKAIVSSQRFNLDAVLDQWELIL